MFGPGVGHVNMLIMGEDSSTSSSVVITCNGQGPVVSVEPNSLDFREVKVLDEKTMDFQLINDSPIPTQFTVTLKNAHSPWIPIPKSGSLEPHGSMTIFVKLALVDAGKFKDKVIVSVINSRCIPVDVKVFGYGCSVTFEPQIFPIYDWGLLFSHQQIDRTITLTNHGTRDYQMYWITDPEIRFRRGQMVMPQKTTFQLQPMIVDIPPGETKHVHCKLFWKVNECLSEKWNVFGQIQGVGKRELIGTSTFTVVLTEPHILFSKSKLTFRVDICPDQDTLQQTDELLVTNQSKLDLNVQLSVKEPFYLITETKEHVQSRKIVLIDGATTTIVVFFFFDHDTEERCSKSYTGVLRFEYEEHPNQDKIPCKGYVNFPNLVIEPEDFVINCELGSSAEEILTLTNNGPVSVLYKFLWLADSIEIHRDLDTDRECPGCSPREAKSRVNTPEIPEVSVATVANEELYPSDRQDGSGYGPLSTIPPPANSPASEIHKPEISSVDEDSDSDDCQVSRQEIREFLIPMVGPYFRKDEDLVVLESMNTDPPKDYYINEVLEIVPNEGTVLPYSVQRVHVGFHGFERLRVKATAVCEIFRGSAARIRVIARADAVRYEIDTGVIDFGQQLFLKYNRKSLVLRNLCAIAFEYEIKDEEEASVDAIDRFDIHPLKVEPNTGFVDAESSVEFHVGHLPTKLGPIDHRFQLEIGHLMPVTIEVIAYGAFPQVYPCLPRGRLHQYHTVELEYRAIQSLTEDFIRNKTEEVVAERETDSLETDAQLLTAEGWCIIPYDETLPRTMDIDMAMERHLARKFVDVNSYILMQHATTGKLEPIPQLFSSEYVIDMKYVIVESTAHYAARVINYGPWNAQMRVRMAERKDSLGRSGITVQLKKRSKLQVGDSAILQVTWHPTRERYTEKSTAVKHSVHVQVIRGCTIPVTIMGIVTYPYVTVNTKFLDFQDVIVGECLVLRILIKNEGLVDCEWEAKLSNVPRRRLQEDYPFYVEYDANYCPPGHVQVVRVSFKPRKMCYVETKLRIVVKMSLETQVIALTGRGIEKNLNVIEPSIEFLPVVPFAGIQEAVFTVENACNYPVEFFWHHLDEAFQMEDRVTKALLHYYKAREILLPPRKPGEPIPWQLVKFYRDTVNEMAEALITEKLEEEEQLGEEAAFGSYERDAARKSGKARTFASKRKTRKAGRSVHRSSARKDSHRGSSHRGKRSEIVSDVSSMDSEGKDCTDFLILDETLLESIHLPTNDPEEIQRLLFCYTDNLRDSSGFLGSGYMDDLRKSSDFRIRMKDPVKELFQSVERKSDASSDLPDSTKPEKRVCVIFHGAPFTEYQEAACRSAKVLEIPVLSIDKAIWEVMALGSSSCSIQLRQIIDDAYDSYTEAFAKQKQPSTARDTQSEETELELTRRTETGKKRRGSPKDRSSRTKESSKSSRKLRTSKSGKNEASEKVAILRLRADPDPMDELERIPASEKLEMLDPLSRYEYKIQAILSLERLVDHRGIADSARDRGDSSPRKKQEASLLGIAPELIAEALQERLSMEDFKRGFVVQSLDSNFLRNNAPRALLSLLQIVGNIEYLLFVTFLNSMTCYDSKVRLLQREIEEKASDHCQKIQDIDQMSSSEYDQLPDEDKEMYLNAILPIKREEASRRRARFIERMMERRKKEIRGNVSSSKTPKRKRNGKPTKHARAASKRSTNSRPPSSKRGTSKATRSRDSSKRRKESVSAEVREILAAMNRYYTDLSLIENAIRNWDPVKKMMELPRTRSKMSRSVRSKDIGPPDIDQDAPPNNFHLWYVRSSDPWQDTMYDVVVSQMKENQLAKSALAAEETPEPDLRPELRSVLRWKSVEKRVRKVYGDVYQLVSLTPITEVHSINESIYVSELSVRENRSNARKGYNRRRQRLGKLEEQKSPNKVENRSMNVSSIESKDTNNDSLLGTVLEEPLKPRWILLPGESQRFKIRFQPEETGHYEETYALTVLGGGNLTYEVNVTGIADVPRLDMNPETIFAKTAETKLHEAQSSTYFYDKGLYDFGSLLVFRKDKRPHRREVRLKFCNVSELEAEVLCSLDENSSECFFVQPQRLLIARGDCATLVLSAIATRLGINQGKLYLCVTNNPKVEVIELQSEGTRLDIELDEKEVSFGLTLLYRMENRILGIRNRTPVSFFWHLRAEEPADPQITFTPLRGLLETRSRQEIELCYHATTVGVVQKKALIFEAFLDEDDDDPIFTDVVLLSGETYDVAVDINNANPIDFKNVRVNFPASAIFGVRNRGDYEVKYVITLEDKEKLEKLNLPGNFKKNLQVQPATGTVAPNKEKSVEMTLEAKTELTLKEAPILKCHLVDTQKETAIIAEIPLNVSLVAYYSRFRINPYPVINFGTLPICSEKTMYLNIENIGSFPLQYSIQLQYRYPSTVYMSQMLPEDPQKKQYTPEKGTSRKGRSIRSSKTETKAQPEMLVLGPMTITKIQGNVEVGQTDSVAISCYPEFVGSQEEQIAVVIADSIPEDRDGKTVTLSVNSAIPSIDFQDLDSIFQENHVVDGMQDFDCPKDIGPHTVFARRERCLYFRYVNVLSTHVTCFKLYNREMVAAKVEIRLLDEALRPTIAKENTFVVQPEREQIPPMSHKVFTVSFTPHVIETFQGAFQATVVLPPHLEPEQLFIKLIGESCVPEVAITEPAHGARERPTLNFVRTLIDESSCRYFTVENVGFIKAKVIIEINEDLNNAFLLSACFDIQHLLQAWDEYCDEPHDRCTAVRLASGNVARFKAIFNPSKTGKHCGKIRLHVVDNPYENLTINLEGECYVESIVLNGLQSEDNNRKVSAGNRDAHRSRRFSSKQNSQASVSSNSLFPVSLTYILDYGLCFVSKIYRKTFKIVNKSTDRWFRFQWSVHPHVVFVPSIGHVKYLTCKEIVATFLASEPTNHENNRIECLVCEILVEDVTTESAWDDRQTEVRWERIHHDIPEQISNLELLAKKIVEPTIEAKHEVIPGTSKSILLLLNATVAFSQCTSRVQEICFKDTLMFQTREYTFLLANPGTVNTMYSWKINMDEQYPKRHIEDASNVTSRSRIADEARSRQYSRLSRGIFSATSETRGRSQEQEQRSVEDSSNVLSRQCSSFESESGDAKGTTSTKPSDLFSSAAALSGRTTDSWLEGDDLPFVICPETGTIPPGESAECTLKFSPKDVFYYKAYLACRIENMEPGQPTLTIPVAARSLLPYCHFDVQESDYVTSNRRDPSLPGPLGYEIDDPALWQNIRVIEFKVVGVGQTHVKKFHLINPTMDDYHFCWTNRTALGTDEVPSFQCTVTEGIAERGKRTDLAFTFLAEQVGVFESFWLFSIGRYNLECLFLVVGSVAEPSVHCLTVHVKLKPTILGFTVRDSVKLLNNEDFHIPFSIVEDSLYSEGKFQKLCVTPMTGSLVSKSEQHFWVEYHPTRVGEFNFSVQCAVKLMKSPLTIFVTACVYDIVSSVSYCKPNDEVVRASENKENVIDLGKLMPEVPVAVKFDITNSCKVAFYYTWQLGMTSEILCRNAYNLTVSQKQGHVISDDRSTCYLTMTTFQKVTIKDHCVLLKIANGPTYKFILKAFSKRPAIEFSFNRYDFGLCYVQDSNSISYRTELRVTNSDEVPFVIECKFEEQPHLSVDLSSTYEALAAGSSIAIPIVFRPLRETRYNECLMFAINSANEKKITITGEGIGYKVRLANPRDKSVDLGSIPASKYVAKRIPVVNEGLAPLDLKFDLIKNLSGYEEHRERHAPCDFQAENASEMARASVMETKRSWTNDERLKTGEPKLSDVLKIEPSSNVVLKPKNRINVVVTFKPTSRMRPFSAKVALQTSSTILPMFLVRGSCVGAEFHLNRTHIPFGTVVQGCVEESKMILMNTGDLGSRFKWNTSKLPRDFQISPTSGYCSAGMDVSFVVKFQPSEQRSLIEGEATIEIEKHEPLKIKITGACCKLPEPIETIRFECLVRGKQTRSVAIMNDSHLPWKLKAEVTGSHFSVDEMLQVPPQQLAPCVVTYSPIAMNTEHTLHTGTLVLKSQDENLHLLYSLRGRSLPPEVTAKITRRFPAKTKYTELLPVQNWLNNQQRFQCEIKLLPIKNAQSKIPLYSFAGNERFDVPSNSQRDYRAVFYCYEKWNFHFKVTFTNDEGEYQFYEIEYEVSEPEVIESIKLATPARFQICHALKVENPLEHATITFTAECFHPFITLSQVPKAVKPLSHDFVYVLYQPTLPLEESVMLMIYGEKLGRFPYELRLKATPAPPHKITRVNATLGSSHAFSLPVNNLAKRTARFLIEVDSECFACPASIFVKESSEGAINVIYEPYDVENVTAMLIASSDTAGEFAFPLVGSCTLPKPTGPYVITRTSSAIIRFKNVFREAKTFGFMVDVPETFTVDTESVVLEPKQSIGVKVSIREDEQDEEEFEEKYPVTGKLMVYCTDPVFSHINWVYYLRALFE